MKKLLACLLLGAGSAQAATFSDAQVKEFCRMTDPMFLKTLPVVLEAKAAGKQRRHVMSLMLYSGYAQLGTTNAGGGGLYLQQFEAIYDDPSVKTVDDAVLLTESNCMKRMQEYNQRNP